MEALGKLSTLEYEANFVRAYALAWVSAGKKEDHPKYQALNSSYNQLYSIWNAHAPIEPTPEYAEAVREQFRLAQNELVRCNWVITENHGTELTAGQISKIALWASTGHPYSPTPIVEPTELTPVVDPKETPFELMNEIPIIEDVDFSPEATPKTNYQIINQYWDATAPLIVSNNTSWAFGKSRALLAYNKPTLFNLADELAIHTKNLVAGTTTVKNLRKFLSQLEKTNAFFQRAIAAYAEISKNPFCSKVEKKRSSTYLQESMAIIEKIDLTTIQIHALLRVYEKRLPIYEAEITKLQNKTG